MALSPRGHQSCAAWLQSTAYSVFAFLAVILSLTGLPQALGACPDHMEAMNDVEMCHQPLGQYKQGTLEGTLTSAEMEAACSEYDKAVSCLRKIRDSCRHPAGDSVVELVESVQSSWASGMGRVCQDKDKYFSYSSCYASEEDKTSSCLVEHDMQSMEQPCETLTALRTCLDQAVQPCGREATNLYRDLVQETVPIFVLEDCLGPATEPSTVGNGSSSFYVISHVALGGSLVIAVILCAVSHGLFLVES